MISCTNTAHGALMILIIGKEDFSEEPSNAQCNKFRKNSWNVYIIIANFTIPRMANLIPSCKAKNCETEDERTEQNLNVLYHATLLYLIMNKRRRSATSCRSSQALVTSVVSHLTAQQVRVAEHRVRQAVRKVDHGGVMLRKRHIVLTERRKYTICAPWALWHKMATVNL